MSASTMVGMDTRAAKTDVRRAVLAVTISSFSIAALMGIGALLGAGGFGETSVRVLLTTVVVVRRVLAKPTVTIQSIYGALSAYLIIGLMFAACYAAIQRLDSQDFFASNEPANTQTLQYFSFTTLTTLGYGDFTAARSGGRSLAVMEAVTGQVFLATLVARLVSAYQRPTLRPRPEDDDGPEGDDEDRS